MDGMQVKEVSCYYPPVSRQPRSNHLSGLVRWILHLFQTILPAFSVYSQEVNQVFRFDISTLF